MAKQGSFSGLLGKLWPSVDEVVGKPVYFEENGEQLGVVKDTIVTTDGKITGYYIENNGVTVQLPAENIKVTENALIFQPFWFTEYENLIKQLEFEEKLNHDLVQILGDRDISREKLEMFISKKEPRLKNLMEEAQAARKILSIRKGEFELERKKLRQELGIISEKRLLGEEGWREYSQKVLDLKRKASILDYNIKRCGDLLIRLDRSPFVIKEKIEVEDKKEQKRDEFPLNYPIPLQMPTPGILPPYLYPETSPVMRPAQVLPSQSPQGSESVLSQQNPKVKKFRVLRIETRMQSLERRVDELENEMRNRIRSEIEGIKTSVKNEIIAELYRNRVEEIDEEIKETEKKMEEGKDEPKFLEYLKKRKKTLEEKKASILEKIKEGEMVVEKDKTPSGHICVACGAEIGDADKCPSCGLSINVVTNGSPSKDKGVLDAKIGTIILFSGLVTAIVAILLLL